MDDSMIHYDKIEEYEIVLPYVSNSSDELSEITPESPVFYTIGEINPKLPIFDQNDKKQARRWCDNLVGMSLEELSHEYAWFQLLDEKRQYCFQNAIYRTATKITLHYLNIHVQEEIQEDYFCDKSMIEYIKAKYFSE
ncbi:MAG: hypothetical protein ACQESE_04675 [Nanobdellota archaeon]